MNKYKWSDYLCQSSRFLCVYRSLVINLCDNYSFPSKCALPPFTLADHFEPYISAQTCSITVILVSFDSARGALSNELLFRKSIFLPQKSAYSPLWFFKFQGPISRSTGISAPGEWYRSTQLAETNRLTYHLTRFGAGPRLNYIRKGS